MDEDLAGHLARWNQLTFSPRKTILPKDDRAKWEYRSPKQSTASGYSSVTSPLSPSCFRIKATKKTSTDPGTTGFDLVDLFYSPLSDWYPNQRNTNSIIAHGTVYLFSPPPLIVHRGLSVADFLLFRVSRHNPSSFRTNKNPFVWWSLSLLSSLEWPIEFAGRDLGYLITRHLPTGWEK